MASRHFVSGLHAIIALAFAGCATSPEPQGEAQDSASVSAAAETAPAAADTPPPLVARLANVDSRQGLSVVRVNDAIRYVEGVNVASNTYVVDTPDGQVIVDTSRPPASAVHKRLLEADGVDNVKYVIVTHAHGDHNGGVPLWRAGGAQVIAQENYNEFLDYSNMLAGFFGRRTAAQFQFVDVAGGGASLAGRQGPIDDSAIRPDITFDKEMSLDVGGMQFELLHTPGETPDHLTVWVPELKAVFVGDNLYESFPNMYTLRGTRPRWPLEYIAAIDRALALEPEVVLPSHGLPIVGKEASRERLTRYRDAIAYVHDAVVAGMNAGKSVETLMAEISLPPELDIGEGYGKISWSVRGIYESYAGWFGGDPAEMFTAGPAGVSDDLVALAGGGAAIAGRAREMLDAGDAEGALQLTSTGLEGAPGDKDLLQVRIDVLETLIAESRNRNEVGWLQHGVTVARGQLENGS